MSTVPAPQPRSPGSTREQLDELDALLQRMLELPVDPAGTDNGPAEPAAPAPPPESEADPAPVLPAVARALEQPPPPPPVPTSGPPVAPSAASEPPAATGPRTHAAHTPSTPAPHTAAVGLPPSRPRPGDGSPAWLLPVAQLNRLFDRLTVLFGAPGSWLRRRRGRTLLGWAGVLLLAAAAVLALATWRGWF
jgi:hypothetical protein